MADKVLEYEQMIQDLLRVGVTIELALPVLFTCLWFFGLISSFSLCGIYCASACTFYMIRVTCGGKIRNWWFLWNPPLIRINRSQNEKQEALKWLTETLDQSDFHIRPVSEVVKFKHKQHAVLFKVMWG